MSESENKTVVVTGGSNGIGAAIIRNISQANPEYRIYNLDKECPAEGSVEGFVSKWCKCDVSYKLQVEHALEFLKIKSIDILINNAGVNFIDWIENTPEAQFDRIIRTNAKSIFNTTRVMMPTLMENNGTILNIVSNASHMPMTNSIAYNASKGAAHIMTLQMSRELGPKGITVFGISPNRVSGTGMSDYIDEKVCGIRGWSKEHAREYQLSALPAGEETDADTLGEFIAFILSTKQRHKYMAGTIIPYGK